MRKFDLFYSIFEIIIGVFALTSIVILLVNGELILKWIPTGILAIVFIVLGVIGIDKYKKG